MKPKRSSPRTFNTGPEALNPNEIRALNQAKTSQNPKPCTPQNTLRSTGFMSTLLLAERHPWRPRLRMEASSRFRAVGFNVQGLGCRSVGHKSITRATKTQVHPSKFLNTILCSHLPEGHCVSVPGNVPKIKRELPKFVLTSSHCLEPRSFQAVGFKGLGFKGLWGFGFKGLRVLGVFA